jgi:hypothetical protein
MNNFGNRIRKRRSYPGLGNWQKDGWQKYRQTNFSSFKAATVWIWRDPGKWLRAFKQEAL